MDTSTHGNTPATWDARGLVFKLRSLIAVITMRYLWTKVPQWGQCGCKLFIASLYCKALVIICITIGGPVIGCNCSSSKQVKICSPILLRNISFLQNFPCFEKSFLGSTPSLQCVTPPAPTQPGPYIERALILGHYPPLYMMPPTRRGSSCN